MPNKKLVILVADDDADDCLLTQEALNETDICNDTYFVEDGEELMAYLHKSPPFQNRPTPDIILLDLNMPRKDGREALIEIKQHPHFKTIPIIAFTTSHAPEDIRYMYQQGVNSYITKPTTFHELIDIMQTLCQYWFKVVCLPSTSKG